MKHSLDHLETIARDAARWEPLPARFIKQYFKGLEFSFGKDYQKGYREFLKRANRIGAVDTIPALKFVEI